MEQLRSAQNDNAALQAQQTASDQALHALQAKSDAQTKQIADLVKQAADTKAATDKSIADLNDKVSAQATQLAQFVDALTKWKAAYTQAAGVAQQENAERVKLASQVIVLQRQVDDEQNKNIQLYRIGSEVLTRYERFGLGDAIGAKEPFVGLTRVNLENLVQGYQDKMKAQKIITASK